MCSSNHISNQLVFNPQDMLFQFDLSSEIECYDLEYVDGNSEQYLVPMRFRMTFDQFLSNLTTNKYNFDFRDSEILDLQAFTFSNNQSVILETSSWQECLESLFKFIGDSIAIGRIFPNLKIKSLQYDYLNRENNNYNWITKYGYGYQYQLPEEKVILEMLSRNIYNHQFNTNDHQKSFCLEYIKLKLKDDVILEIYQKDEI